MIGVTLDWEGYTMKAVILEQYGAPEVLKLVEREIPQPGEGELLVRMHTASVAKPDYLMRTGAYPWTKGILPFTPGLCGSGRIVALGAGVEGFRVGQGVFIDHPIACGCYSEYKLVPTANAFLLPEGTDLQLAATMSNYVIGWSLLKNCCLPGEGKTLYMKGAAGALGSAVVQLAPLLGLTVIASASAPEKCAYLRTLGVERVFCYRDTDERQALMDYTHGAGVDYLLDQCAGAQFAGELDLLNRRGTIIIYNTLGGMPKENVIQLLTDHYDHCPAVRAFSFHLHDGRSDELNALKTEVFTLLAHGKLHPHVGAVYAQQDIQAAHRRLDAGDCLGSILLTL